MIARGFRSVGWVAGIAATALGCYMVNLKVASERAALEDVETRIVLAQRDIRLLQTEIGTRGRLEQLEKWNVKVLALSAPQANQFLEGSFQLATLMRPDEKVDPEAPMVLAAAPAAEPKGPVIDSDGPAPQPIAARPADLMHVASLKVREPKTATGVKLKTEATKPDPAPVDAKKKAVEKPTKAPAASAASAVKPAKQKKESIAVAEAKPKPKPTAATAAKTKAREAQTKQ
jgi:hypothetical protein